MNNSPVRHPVFCLLCITALTGAVAARQHNPVEALAIEKIESRYFVDRTACQALVGAERRHCNDAAELRYDVSLSELERLRNDSTTALQNDEARVLPAAAPS